MPLRNFIKENFVLVTGLALPMLLVIGFLVISQLPKAAATPPAYEALFTTYVYGAHSATAPYSTDIRVEDGKLVTRIWKNPNDSGVSSEKLMAYNAKTGTIREVTYTLPEDLGEMPASGGKTIDLEAFKDIRVSPETTAPDGYTFETARYGGGWPMRELFGGGYGDHRPRLVKGAAAFPLPDNSANHYSYYDVQFLGWIVGK